MSSPNPGAASARLQGPQALLNAGRFAEAEAGFRELLGSGITAAAGPLATLLLQQERDRDAADLLEPLVRAEPGNGEWVVTLSVALRRLRRFDEALEHARRGVELLPQAVPAWNALGVAALEAERFEEALAAFDAGLKAAPGHPALAFHRAMTLRGLARNEQALPAFQQLVQAFPQAVEAWRGLADAQAALGQTEAALRSRERACALAPNDADVAHERASTLLVAGRAADAARHAEAVLRLRDDRPRTWLLLAHARQKTNDLAGAKTAIERARALAPDDEMIAHFHAALAGVLPDAVETGYIRTLFDDFADSFEHELVDQLRYDTPAQLARLLARLGADSAQTVLDLGCGTGLMAEQLARPGRFIDGLDLSPRMLERARAKGLYRDLHARELTEFLAGTTQCWDLIVATDVFIYVPHPEAAFAPALARLMPGGWFGFSIELSAGENSELMPQTGRYRQSPERMTRELAAAGFVDVVTESIVVRLESGQPVPGALIVARRALD